MSIIQTTTQWFDLEQELSPELRNLKVAGGSRHTLYVNLDDIIGLEHLHKDNKEWLLYLKDMYDPFVLSDEEGGDLLQKWMNHVTSKTLSQKN